MDSKLIDQQDYVRIEVSHHISMKDARQLLDAVHELVNRSRMKPVLVCSKDASPLALLDLYIFARLIVETPLRNCRIAFLYEGDPDFDSSQFLRTIIEDHKLQLAVFATLPEAVQWFADNKRSR